VGGDAERPPAGIDGVGRPAQGRGDPLPRDACAVPPPEGGVLLPGPAAGHQATTNVPFMVRARALNMTHPILDRW
jgi:hypothetical protein